MSCYQAARAREAQRHWSSPGIERNTIAMIKGAKSFSSRLKADSVCIDHHHHGHYLTHPCANEPQSTRLFSGRWCRGYRLQIVITKRIFHRAF
jgi:hypothetical protein